MEDKIKKLWIEYNLNKEDSVRNEIFNYYYPQILIKAKQLYYKKYIKSRINLEDYLAYYNIAALELIQFYDYTIMMPFSAYCQKYAEIRVTYLLGKYEYPDSVYVYKRKNKIKNKIREAKAEGKSIDYIKIQKEMGIKTKSQFLVYLSATYEMNGNSKYAIYDEEDKATGYTKIVEDFDYLEFKDTIKDVLNLIEKNSSKKTKELYKKIFILYFITGMHVEDIANELGMNIKTCESAILRNIMPKLRIYFKKK